MLNYFIFFLANIPFAIDLLTKWFIYAIFQFPGQQTVKMKTYKMQKRTNLLISPGGRFNKE